MTRNLSLFLGIGMTLAGCFPPVGKDDDDAGDVGSDTDLDTDSDTDSDTGSDTDTGATLASLAYDEAGYDLVLGEAASLSVTGTWDDGSTSDETDNCGFSSADDAVAVADASTLVGTGDGATEVSCAIDTVETSAPVTVSVLEIGGRAHMRGHGLQGVELWVSADGVDPRLAGESDDATGSFTVGGLGYGTVTVTPRLLGNRFEPASYELEIDASTDLTRDLDFEQVGQAFPIADDGFTNNDIASAEPFGPGGALVTRAIWPFGGEDWFTFELSAGESVNVYTANLAANTDSYLVVYEANGTTEYDDNDDCHVGYDSCVKVSSGGGGTFYAKVVPLDEEVGVLQYAFGMEAWTDADDDDYSTFHDCNDGDSDVNPEEGGDEARDGIDYDCDGIVRTSAGAADPVDAAGTDETASPRQGVVVWNNPWNLLYANWHVADTAATLTDESDVDRYAIEIPAKGAVDFWPTDALFDDDGQSDESVYVVSYDTDGTTERAADFDGVRIENTSGAAATFFVEVVLEGRKEVFYIPSFTSVGVDADGDGFYSQDWDESRDCDDGDMAVTDGCY